jgi:hypothetical protein
VLVVSKDSLLKIVFCGGISGFDIAGTLTNAGVI